MNYIGSKLSLLGFLDESISKVITGTETTFCDIFAGTGAVGAHFKKKGYSVTSNDLQYYSYVLNRHYVGNHRRLDFTGLMGVVPSLNKSETERARIVCDYLTALPEIRGFVYQNYCVGDNEENSDARMYFSNENGKKCDAARLQIEEWNESDLITGDEYYFLLTSLLESIDKLANTASVYGAFLKKLKKSAQKSLQIVPAQLIENDQDHIVYNEDANSIISEVDSEILYLDPPYNHRQYASNYHVLETIARYDNPILYGKTGLRDYSSQKSLYSSRAKVKQTFTDLISESRAKYVFLSYNNEGLLKPEEIESIMSEHGEYGFFKNEYRRFRADADASRHFAGNKTVEFLHYLKRGS